MTRLNLSNDTLAGLGFLQRELGDGVHDYVLPLKDGWTIEYADGVGMELVHEGHAVPLRCEGKEHLEQLIKVL